MTTILFSKRMRYAIVLFILVENLCPLCEVNAQTKTKEGGRFVEYPMVGIGFGFISPRGIADDVERIEGSMQPETWDGTYNISLESDDLGADPFSSMLCVNATLGVAYRYRWSEFGWGLDCSFGPMESNWIESGSFTRIAGMALFNYHIPISDYNSFVFGTAFHLNSLKYKTYSDVAPGYKIQMGFSVQSAHLNIMPYLAYNRAQGADTRIPAYRVDLNYSSFQVGVVFAFHKGIYYSK